MPRPCAALSLAFLAGCTAARLTGPEPFTPADPGQRVVVVVEPFFESAQWEISLRAERATVFGPYGAPQEVTLTREVAEKHLFARVASLTEEQRQVIAEVQKLRPSWQVTSTGGLPALFGPVTLVRVVVGELETVASDRALKSLAFGFGILIPPLLLIDLDPVHETQRVHGAVTRYEAEAEELKQRLLRYPTQPDYAVDTRKLNPLVRPYGLDLELQEGVLAAAADREVVLLSGFARRLAAAVVAIVEERH
ncbi:MAG: hypothetical protein HYZ28_26315 [Myxococcales bacterium]|nr:hypothetical protein [Myxococcales bacterium]